MQSRLAQGGFQNFTDRCSLKYLKLDCYHQWPCGVLFKVWSSAFLLALEPPVRFKQPLIDLEVWERDLAVLECEVPEDSVPITWYLEDRRLQPGAKYGMEEWGTKRRLTIRDIGIDDDGIYLCEMPDGGRSIAEVAVKGKRDEISKHYLGVYTDISNKTKSMFYTRTMWDQPLCCLYLLLHFLLC